jgi:hypothetical protein
MSEQENPCPWCGEDTAPQGGLEAHISEPCAEYLAELPEWMRPE